MHFEDKRYKIKVGKSPIFMKISAHYMIAHVLIYLKPYKIADLRVHLIKNKRK